ncbi:MAG: hypothetical protein ACXVAM_04000 [Vulcanimicrobiaceae bacterium]
MLGPSIAAERPVLGTVLSVTLDGTTRSCTDGTADGGFRDDLDRRPDGVSYVLMRRRIDLVDVGKLTGHLDFRAGRNERSEQYQPNGVAKRRWSVEKEVANGAEEVAAARRGLNTRVIFLGPGKNTEQMSQGAISV